MKNEIERRLAERGYATEDYLISLQIYDATNQVIVITDIPNHRWMGLPVEGNVLAWSPEQIVDVVVTAIDEANVLQDVQNLNWSFD